MKSITDFTPEAIVIDAGTFPTSPIPLIFLKNCSRIVCCDGAADEYLSKGGYVWRIVGDCDSLSEDILLRYNDIIVRIPDQETNDQTKAISFLSSLGLKKVVILGATGRREDHTIGNISLLVEYLKAGIEARIYTDYGVFIPAINKSEFRCRPGSQISIFNFGATGMKSEGLKYPIRDFNNWWQGTLNETYEDSFLIDAKGYYLVFINY